MVFALKYEGINLLVFKKLFEKISKKEIAAIINIEPTGLYVRKIWFLYEWLMAESLDVPDADVKIKYSDLLDSNKQFAVINGIKSSRHRIINNLPGTVDFCPLIFKTIKLKNYIEENLSQKKDNYLKTSL